MNTLQSIYTPTAKIFTFLTVPEISQLARPVCKRWNEVVESNVLWFALISRDFPEFKQSGGEFEEVFERTFFRDSHHHDAEVNDERKYKSAKNSQEENRNNNPVSIWFCPGRAFYAFANLAQHGCVAAACSMVYLSASHLAPSGCGKNVTKLLAIQQHNIADNNSAEKNNSLLLPLTLDARKLARSVSNDRCSSGEISTPSLFLLRRLLADCVTESRLVTLFLQLRDIDRNSGSYSQEAQNAQPEHVELLLNLAPRKWIDKKRGKFEKQTCREAEMNFGASSENNNNNNNDELGWYTKDMLREYFLVDIFPQIFDDRAEIREVVELVTENIMRNRQQTYNREDEAEYVEALFAMRVVGEQIDEIRQRGANTATGQNPNITTLAADFKHVFENILIPVENNLISSFFYLGAGTNMLELVKLLISPIYIFNMMFAATCWFLLGGMYSKNNHNEDSSLPMMNEETNDSRNSSSSNLFSWIVTTFASWHGESFFLYPVSALLPTLSISESVILFLTFSIPWSVVIAFVGEYFFASVFLRTSLEEKSLHLHFERMESPSIPLKWGVHDDASSSIDNNYRQLRFSLQTHLHNIFAYSSKMSLYRAACLAIVSPMFHRAVIQPFDQQSSALAVLTRITLCLAYFSSSSFWPSVSSMSWKMFFVSWGTLLMFLFGGMNPLFDLGCSCMMGQEEGENNNNNNNNIRHNSETSFRSLVEGRGYSCSSMLYSSGLMAIMSFVLLSTNFMTYSLIAPSSLKKHDRREIDTLRTVLQGLNRASIAETRKYLDSKGVGNNNNNNNNNKEKSISENLKKKMQKNGESSKILFVLQKFGREYLVHSEMLHYVRWGVVDFLAAQILVKYGGSIWEVFVFNFLQSFLVAFVSQILVPALG